MYSNSVVNIWIVYGVAALFWITEFGENTLASDSSRVANMKLTCSLGRTLPDRVNQHVSIWYGQSDSRILVLLSRTQHPCYHPHRGTSSLLPISTVKSVQAPSSLAIH